MTEKLTILDHIGNTPLLKLNHVSDLDGVDIFVKCEFTNPDGSIKDRMALCMIEEAEKEVRGGPQSLDSLAAIVRWNPMMVFTPPAPLAPSPGHAPEMARRAKG